MADEVGVKFGIDAGILFVLSGVVVGAGLSELVGIALLLGATVASATALDPRHAVALAVAGWALATGFAVHELGVLTFSPHDLLRLALFVVLARVVVHRRATR